MRAQLRRYVEGAELAANTIRAHVGALERALLALHRRGHAAPSFAELLPRRDADLDAPAAAAAVVDVVIDQLEHDRGDTAPRTLAAIHLTLHGLRPGEIVELRRRDVDLAGGGVLVGGDLVELGDAARLALADWLRARGTGAMVFPITTRQLQRDVARAADAAGCHLSLVEVRRRAIVDVFARADIHAAARFARVKNPSELRRVLARNDGGPGQG